MPRVFVSYDSDDWGFVKNEVLDVLHAMSVETWCAAEDIQPGDAWESKIREGLHDCDYFLVAISANSVKSKWVYREVCWADENRDGLIVCVVLDDAKPGDLHLGLGTLHHIDYSHGFDEARPKLIRTIQNLSQMRDYGDNSSLCALNLDLDRRALSFRTN